MSRPPEAAGLPVLGTVRREAWCFAAGSALFATGSALSAWSTWPARPVGAVFFAGSLLFTTAALIQFSLAGAPGGGAAPARWSSLRAWRLSSPALDQLASGIQLIGTVLFNINTLRAVLLTSAGARASDLLIWAPDALGSLAFLVASLLACLPAVRARRHTHVRGRSWWIALVNLLGSVLFGLAALGALLLPTTGQPVNVRWVDAGTGLGALCFLAGALLLLPARGAPAPGRSGRAAGP
jgi:hypothetical protein